jgi:aspartate/methionine/tyrosine aminotransferase
MGLATIEAALARLTGNQLLNVPGIDPMASASGDLRGDQPAGALDGAIAAAAAHALESGQTHYVDVPGIAPLREATARLLSEQGARCGAGNLMVTAGIQEARFLALQVLGDAFGPLALPDSVHPGVRQALGIRAIEHQLLATDPERGMLVDLPALRAALTAGARLIYLEAPVRLTGAHYDEATLRAIAALAAEHEAGLIVDQGLAPWSDGPTAGAVLAAEGLKRTALLGELAPGLGLQSWQIGYLAADEAWLPPLQSLKQVMSICTSTASQFAALEAMEHLAGTWAPLRKDLSSRREEARAVAAERGLNPLPGGALSVLALRPRDAEATRAALIAAGCTPADGASFGAPGVLRLAVAADNDLAAVLRTIG